MKCLCGKSAIFTGFTTNNLTAEDNQVVARPFWICSDCKSPIRECGCNLNDRGRIDD